MVTTKSELEESVEANTTRFLNSLNQEIQDVMELQ